MLELHDPQRGVTGVQLQAPWGVGRGWRVSQPIEQASECGTRRCGHRGRGVGRWRITDRRDRCAGCRRDHARQVGWQDRRRCRRASAIGHRPPPSLVTAPFCRFAHRRGGEFARRCTGIGSEGVRVGITGLTVAIGAIPRCASRAGAAVTVAACHAPAPRTALDGRPLLPRLLVSAAIRLDPGVAPALLSGKIPSGPGPPVGDRGRGPRPRARIVGPSRGTALTGARPCNGRIQRSCPLQRARERLACCRVRGGRSRPARRPAAQGAGRGPGRSPVGAIAVVAHEPIRKVVRVAPAGW